MGNLNPKTISLDVICISFNLERAKEKDCFISNRLGGINLRAVENSKTQSVDMAEGKRIG